MRQKKKVISNVSKESAEEAFLKYNSAIVQLQKIETTINLSITNLREKNAEAIRQWQLYRDEQFAIIEMFAKENPGLFDKKKSHDLTHGTIGFRTGMPKLALLKGVKWDGVLAMVKEFLPNYIKYKEDVDKEKLINDRGNEGMTENLAKIGLEVKQDETFYVAPAFDSIT